MAMKMICLFLSVRQKAYAVPSYAFWFKHLPMPSMATMPDQIMCQHGRIASRNGVPIRTIQQPISNMVYQPITTTVMALVSVMLRINAPFSIYGQVI